MQVFLPLPTPAWHPLDLEGADVRLMKGFLSRPEADAALAELRSAVAWRQDTIRIFGKVHPVPRLQQWFGDPGLSYRWSGIAMDPMPWTPLLSALRNRIEEATGKRPNSVLANLYRDGNDTVGWHADDEPELGPNPFIASLSLGAERDFVLRRRVRDGRADVSLALPHGSLLVMQGPTQANWLHSLPRRKKVAADRINLTFRLMPVPQDDAAPSTAQPLRG